MGQESLLPRVLFFFGIGFFVANVKVIVDLLRFRVRKASALLIWQGAKPRYYGFTLALGAILGMLVAFKIFVLGRQPDQLLGEVMMFVYYGYAFPLSTRIARGLLSRRRLVGQWFHAVGTDFRRLLERERRDHARAHFPFPAASPAGWRCRATSTARPGDCSRTGSRRTTSTSAARGSTWGAEARPTRCDSWAWAGLSTRVPSLSPQSELYTPAPNCPIIQACRHDPPGKVSSR